MDSWRLLMKRALELAALIFVLTSGNLLADKPADPEPPVISPSENSGNSLPVLAEAQPPAKVPASRAARAEWQRRLEQRRIEMQRRGQAAPGRAARNEPARRGEAANSKGKPGRRSDKRQTNDSKNPKQKKRTKKKGADSGKSKKPDSKPSPAKKPKRPGKPAGKTKPDAQQAPAKDAKNDASSDLPVIVPMAVRVPSYAAVRATIPFSRSEWEADPSYRHNATMELMLGQLRDMVVYRYPPMAGPMTRGSGVTINNGGGSQFPNYGFGGFGGVPFGFNPGLNGVIQSRGIINSFQTQGFIGRGAPVLP
jgi:hypothetical protein